MGQRLSLTSKLKPIGGGVAKASLNRANEFVGLDPKPGELSMSRVKRAEHARGGPNPDLLQKVGMTCG